MTGERDVLRLTGRFPADGLATRLGGLEELEILLSDEETLTLAVRDATKRLPEIFSVLGSSGAEIRESTLTQPNLQSLFIKMTGKALRE
jgi:ABC-2 type transport system ATP-binding protein